MQILHPTYELRVTVRDVAKNNEPGSLIMCAQDALGRPYVPPSKPHKYFDGASGKIGCDEVTAAVSDALAKAGINASVWFESFSHKG